MRRLWPLVLVLGAACQTESRRLLVLDLTLADPLALETTAAPWHAAGYRVEYRRFYPHLTRLDLTRYRTVLVLGGREPERPSDALTIGDLSILTEWLHRDGVVVLGYTDGDGGLDRWVMNQWLASQGAGITIGTQSLNAPATPLPHSALDNAGFEPFLAGRNRVLQVRDRNQTLARAGGDALVAASRVDEGLILVASRSLLSSIDAHTRTHDFLVALARWTRRPAEWATIGAAAHAVPLRLANAPQHVAVHPPQLAPPTGSVPILLPEPVGVGAGVGGTIVAPNWIARQGMRVLWSRFALYSLDSLLSFVDVAALNALATKIPEAALADTLNTRNLWKVAGDRLQATSVHWFPAAALAALPPEVGPSTQSLFRRLRGSVIPTLGRYDEVNRHGELMPIACGLDSLYWRSALRPAYRMLSHLGGPRPAPDVLTGVALDLDSAMMMYQGSGFCDADYRAGLTALGLDSAVVNGLLALPPPVRYDTLLEHGWLGAYFAALEAAVAERAVALRAEMRRLRPDLRFAFRATTAPADWFSLGLLRGLSSPDAPVLLWLREIPTSDPRTLLHRYQERGISALSALGLDPQGDSFAPARLPRLRLAVFSEHAGFWLDGAATDSLGRLLRRLTK
ncbi:MAG TPA: hypothetical protein VH439_15460 [Gemmatimonadales bacterium]